MKVDIPTTLFPETQAAFRSSVSQTAIATAYVEQVLDALGTSDHTAVGALFSALTARVCRTAPATAAEFADKANCLGGFAHTLLAYTTAPDHATGLAAMAAAAKASNERQFQALDAVVATRVAPRS